MGLFSFFKSGNYFDKNMAPKCDYCRFGKRAKDGNKVICEHRGLVDTTYSCSKFVYSPLKRIPVKQLNFVGSLADEDIYIESAGDRAEKEKEASKQNNDNQSAKNNSEKNDSVTNEESKNNQQNDAQAQDTKENAPNENKIDDKSSTPVEEKNESDENKAE